MTLKEVKNSIINGNALEEFIIFVCTDPKAKKTKATKINYGAHYIANQYAKELSSLRGLDITHVETLTEAADDVADVVMGGSTNLYIIDTDVFSEQTQDYTMFNNVIVICDKLDKKIAGRLEPFCVYIPEPIDWAMKDYMDKYCPGVDPYLLAWLYDITGGNTYRICAELDKVKLFNTDKRTAVLQSLRNDPATDLYTNTIFNFVDAIFTHDIAKIRTMRQHIDCLNADPVGLATLLLRKYRSILLAICTNMTPVELGMSPQQYGYIKGHYNNINNPEVIAVYRKKIKFLAGIDLRLKQSKLQMPTNLFVDYIINNMLA